MPQLIYLEDLRSVEYFAPEKVGRDNADQLYQSGKVAVDIGSSSA